MFNGDIRCHYGDGDALAMRQARDEGDEGVECAVTSRHEAYPHIQLLHNRIGAAISESESTISYNIHIKSS